MHYFACVPVDDPSSLCIAGTMVSGPCSLGGDGDNTGANAVAIIVVSAIVFVCAILGLTMAKARGNKRAVHDHEMAPVVQTHPLYVPQAFVPVQSGMSYQEPSHCAPTSSASVSQACSKGEDAPPAYDEISKI